MERIVHSAISVNKPKPTEINVTKSTPNLVTEAIVIEKPRHIEVTVSKGSVGVNGRNGRDGTNGMNGASGKDGAVFVPNVQDGMITWDLEDNITKYPSPINMLASIDRITNPEIYNIVNGDS